MEITNVSIMTKAECAKYEDYVPGGMPIWLKDASDYREGMAWYFRDLVYETDDVDFWYEVVPIITCDVSKYREGTRIKFGGRYFVVVDDNHILCTQSIGDSMYDSDTSKFAKYEDSEICYKVKCWYSRHKNEKMYLIKEVEEEI